MTIGFFQLFSATLLTFIGTQAPAGPVEKVAGIFATFRESKKTSDTATSFACWQETKESDHQTCTVTATHVEQRTNGACFVAAATAQVLFNRTTSGEWSAADPPGGSCDTVVVRLLSNSGTRYVRHVSSLSQDGLCANLSWADVKQSTDKADAPTAFSCTMIEFGDGAGLLP